MQNEPPLSWFLHLFFLWVTGLEPRNCSKCASFSSRLAEPQREYGVESRATIQLVRMEQRSVLWCSFAFRIQSHGMSWTRQFDKLQLSIWAVNPQRLRWENTPSSLERSFCRSCDQEPTPRGRSDMDQWDTVQCPNRYWLVVSKNYGKSPLLVGKSTINGNFQ